MKCFLSVFTQRPSVSGISPAQWYVLCVRLKLSSLHRNICIQYISLLMNSGVLFNLLPICSRARWNELSRRQMGSIIHHMLHIPCETGHVPNTFKSHMHDCDCDSMHMLKWNKTSNYCSIKETISQQIVRVCVRVCVYICLWYSIRRWKMVLGVSIFVQLCWQ